MTDGVEFLTRGVLIGVGAAALMDAWALFARRACRTDCVVGS